MANSLTKFCQNLVPRLVCSDCITAEINLSFGAIRFNTKCSVVIPFFSLFFQHLCFANRYSSSLGVLGRFFSHSKKNGLPSTNLSSFSKNFTLHLFCRVLFCCRLFFQPITFTRSSFFYGSLGKAWDFLHPPFVLVFCTSFDCLLCIPARFLVAIFSGFLSLWFLWMFDFAHFLRSLIH